MRILVTGASGFLGQAVKKAFETESDADTFTYLNGRSDLDLTNANAVASCVRWVQPDIIVHLAGQPLIKDESSQTILNNVVSTNNLLETKFGGKFIYASTLEVYGDAFKHIYEGYSPSSKCIAQPNSVYGNSKRAAEKLIELAERHGKISRFHIMRFGAIIGANQTHGAFKDIVRKVVFDNPPVKLLGDEPGSIRPYIYVGDVARCIEEHLLKSESNSIINVCPDDVISIKEMTELIMDYTGIYKPIEWAGESIVWKGNNNLVKVVGDWDSSWYHHKTSREAVLAALKDAYKK